jgi:hypothetical protein
LIATGRSAADRVQAHGSHSATTDLALNLVSARQRDIDSVDRATQPPKEVGSGNFMPCASRGQNSVCSFVHLRMEAS